MKALSGNDIYDLNIRDLVDNILTENDNEYTKSNEGNNNSLRDYILQNIESDNNYILWLCLIISLQKILL